MFFFIFYFYFLKFIFKFYIIVLFLPNIKMNPPQVSIWSLSYSFWLTSLCIIGSSFIHLIRTDSVVSNSLRPHGLQHTWPPCPSPISRVYPNLCPLSWWCHPAISSSVVPFSSPLPRPIGLFSMSISQLLPCK